MNVQIKERDEDKQKSERGYEGEEGVLKLLRYTANEIQFMQFCNPLLVMTGNLRLWWIWMHKYLFCFQDFLPELRINTTRSAK